jgi:hypothetical protein
MKRYDPDDVREVVAEIAKAAGVPEQDAETLADSLVDADINGLSTHGVSRVNIYTRRIQKGLIDPKAEISFDKKGSSVIAVDAGNGLGQVQASKVLDHLISMAKTGGIAAATIRNSQHFGALSYYCNRAARENMILIAMTTAEPSMSPEGGTQAYFGTNPIAASFPTGKAFNFIRIDLSTSLVARGIPPPTPIRRSWERFSLWRVIKVMPWLCWWSSFRACFRVQPLGHRLGPCIKTWIESRMWVTFSVSWILAPLWMCPILRNAWMG